MSYRFSVLVLLALLAYVEPVFAGQQAITESNTCYAYADGKADCGETVCSIDGVVIPCPIDTMQRKKPDCLTQMEAAMRAGKPYIFDGETFSYSWIHPDDPVRNTQEQLGYSITQDALKRDMERRLANVTQLWIAAEACWRTP